MKRFSFGLALVASLALAATAVAAPSRLRTEVFTDAGTAGTGAQALVFSSTSVRVIVTEVGDYAAVFTSAKSPAGKLLIDVDEGFVLEAGSIITGGSPRISLPIDMDGNGTWDDFASIDGNACGAVLDANGVVQTDVLVSTTNPDCTVSLNGGGTYANWDDLAAAQPTWRIAKGQQSFIVADFPQTDATLTSIDLN